MVYKHAFVAAFAFILSVVKILLKGEVGGHALYIVMKITLSIMEKSWNHVFEFLWEP